MGSRNARLARYASIVSLGMAWVALGGSPAVPPSFGVPRDELPLCGVRTSEMVVALSFDGGPGPYTDSDLSLVHGLGMHATFFVTGKHLASYPDAIDRELALGMDVENHTWTHPLMPLLPASDQLAEVGITQNALMVMGAPRPTLWRPPYGAADGTTLDLASWLGLRTVLWDQAVEIRVRYPIPNPEARAREIAESVRPGQIILAHDSIPLASTTETLKFLLPILSNLGYRVVSVSKLLKMGSPVLGHARWGTEIDGHPVLRGGCPSPWPLVVGAGPAMGAVARSDDSPASRYGQ